MQSEEDWSEVKILANFKSLSPKSSPLNKNSSQAQIKNFIHNNFKKLEQTNTMQLSQPFTEVTTASVNNFTQQKEDITLEQMNKKYEQQKKYFPSNLEALKNMERKIQKNYKIKIQSKTQFPLVRNVAVNQFGWSLMSKQDHKELIDIIWTDTYVTQQLVNRLRPYQKINHFPHSTQLGRKDSLFINLNKMRQKFDQQYNFYAKTWIFPQDYQKFKQQTQSKKNPEKSYFIAKPVASCQGKGIHLGKKSDMLHHNSQGKLIVQQYLNNPLLIDGLKFDLRIYVLIKSLEPLQIYVYKQGLTRLATNKYEKANQTNYKNGRMHLTNYAINKNNPEFIHNKDFRKDNIGHKRSLASVYDQIQKMGGNSRHIKQKINQIIVKAILSAYEKMTSANTEKISSSIAKQFMKNISIVNATEDGFFSNQGKSLKMNPQKIQPSNNSKSFQLLGFDIMINQNFQPMLIQINHQPSLTASSPLDYIIKKCLLIDVFNLLQINSAQKQKYLNSRREGDSHKIGKCLQIKTVKTHSSSSEKIITEMGGFSLICPCQDAQLMIKYQKLQFFVQIFNENTEKRVKRLQNISNKKFQSQSQQKSSARFNKTSLSKKRQYFICNYINMLTPGNFFSKKQQSSSILKFNKSQQTPKNQGLYQLKPVQMPSFISQSVRSQSFNNKNKSFNMAQLSLPKKNLNFTIKYKRNSKNGTKANCSINSEKDKHLQNPEGKVPARMTVYNTKLAFENSNLQNVKTLHSNFQSDSRFNSVRTRHTSHQNRIGIRLIKQDNQELGKIQITTKNIFNSSIKQRTISLDKYTSLLQKNSQNTNNHNQGIIYTTRNNISRIKQSQINQQEQISKPSTLKDNFSNQFEKNSEQINNKAHQNSVYQKQLLIRIQNMKNMKQKIERIKKNYTKKQGEIQLSKDQFRVKNANTLLNASQNLTKHPNVHNKQVTHYSIKQTIHSHHHKEKDNHASQRESFAYQTIKLFEFEQPHKKKVSHNNSYNQNGHINFQKDGKDQQNQSLQMFRDQRFYKTGKISNNF